MCHLAYFKTDFKGPTVSPEVSPTVSPAVSPTGPRLWDPSQRATGCCHWDLPGTCAERKAGWWRQRSPPRPEVHQAGDGILALVPVTGYLTRQTWQTPRFFWNLKTRNWAKLLLVVVTRWCLFLAHFHPQSPNRFQDKPDLRMVRVCTMSVLVGTVYLRQEPWL